MTRGILLIIVEPSQELEVFEHLLKLEEAYEVTPVLGTVDFIVRIEGEDHDDIAKTVIKKVRIIKGVSSTKTFIEDEFMKQLESLYK